jgi:hypothetical protein
MASDVEDTKSGDAQMRNSTNPVYAHGGRAILNSCSGAASLGIIKGLAISGNQRLRGKELRMIRSLLN